MYRRHRSKLSPRKRNAEMKPPTSDWDLNPAKTHSTWFQNLMKLRLLMFHHRKNSVREKVIGKKWIYSDSEKYTPQTECGPSQRVSTAMRLWHG